MKSLVIKQEQLVGSSRWDSDFHLPPIHIQKFDQSILTPVSKCAVVQKTKRDPTQQPDAEFLYIDISCVHVEFGEIVSPQELIGREAPSRARKVVKAGDIVISTCRPTRGAIAVVPNHLDDQICSTGFSVIRALPDVNPLYLHFALRLKSTFEQFRKFSTGASYPAILDADVEKALIPLPQREVQNEIAQTLLAAKTERDEQIAAANQVYHSEHEQSVEMLFG